MENIIDDNNKKENETISENIINDKEEKNKDIKQNMILEKNNMIDDLWKPNSKYKIKYNNLIEYIQIRNKNNEEINMNHFFCNILLIPSNIELSDKISIFNFLSSYYNKSEFLLNLGYKIDRKGVFVMLYITNENIYYVN